MTDLGTIFSWTEAYEGDAPTADLRREVDRKLAAIQASAAELAADIRSGGLHRQPNDADAVRADLAHVLANLNSAELHVSDYLGS